MRRWRRRGQGGGEAGIDMAPLIDMIFILLIFFIVTTSFVRESGVRVQRPESSQARRLAGGFLPVAITRDGAVHVAGRVIGADDRDAIAAALAAARVDRVVLQADHAAPTGLTLRVQATCLEAGASQVDVAAITAGRR